MKTRRKLGTRICSIALAACILLGLLPMSAIIALATVEKPVSVMWEPRTQTEDGVVAVDLSATLTQSEGGPAAAMIEITLEGAAAEALRWSGESISVDELVAQDTGKTPPDATDPDQTEQDETDTGASDSDETVTEPSVPNEPGQDDGAPDDPATGGSEPDEPNTGEGDTDEPTTGGPDADVSNTDDPSDVTAPTGADPDVPTPSEADPDTTDPTQTVPDVVGPNEAATETAVPDAAETAGETGTIAGTLTLNDAEPGSQAVLITDVEDGGAVLRILLVGDSHYEGNLTFTSENEDTEVSVQGAILVQTYSVGSIPDMKAPLLESGIDNVSIETTDFTVYADIPEEIDVSAESPDINLDDDTDKPTIPYLVKLQKTAAGSDGKNYTFTVELPNGLALPEGALTSTAQSGDETTTTTFNIQCGGTVVATLQLPKGLSLADGTLLPNTSDNGFSFTVSVPKAEFETPAVALHEIPLTLYAGELTRSTDAISGSITLTVSAENDADTSRSAFVTVTAGANFPGHDDWNVVVSDYESVTQQIYWADNNDVDSRPHWSPKLGDTGDGTLMTPKLYFTLTEVDENGDVLTTFTRQELTKDNLDIVGLTDMPTVSYDPNTGVLSVTVDGQNGLPTELEERDANGNVDGRYTVSWSLEPPDTIPGGDYTLQDIEDPSSVDGVEHAGWYFVRLQDFTVTLDVQQGIARELTDTEVQALLENFSFHWDYDGMPDGAINQNTLADMLENGLNASYENGKITISGLWEYSISGTPITYYLTETADDGETSDTADGRLSGGELPESLTGENAPLDENDWYSILYNNTGVPNAGNESTAVYNEGTLTLVRGGETTYTAYKVWMDSYEQNPEDSTVRRPDVTFTLYRYLRSEGIHTASNYAGEDGAPVEVILVWVEDAAGDGGDPTDGTDDTGSGETTGGEDTAEPAGGRWEIQVVYADGENKGELAALPQYDGQSGSEWIYVVRETLDSTYAGQYEQQFGEVTWDDESDEWVVEEDDLADWGLTERAPNNTYLYNGDTLTNLQSNTVSASATKVWKAANFQSGFDNVAVELTLQVHEAGQGDGWRDYTDESGNTITRYLYDFSAVKLTDTLTDRLAMPQYSGNGDRTQELEYRWLETAVYTGVTGDTRKDVTNAIENNAQGITKYPVTYGNTSETSSCTSDAPTGTLTVEEYGRSYAVSYDGETITNSVQDTVSYEVIKEWHGDSLEEAIDAGKQKITLQIFRAVTGQAFNYNDPYLVFTMDGTDGKTLAAIQTNPLPDDAEDVQVSWGIPGYGPENSEYTEWPITVTGLPAYDADGQAYEYILLELTDGNVSAVYENRPTDTADYRTAVINGEGSGGFNLLVRKTWLDNSDTPHREPVTFTLYNKTTGEPIQRKNSDETTSDYTITLGPNIWSSVVWIGTGDMVLESSDLPPDSTILDADDVYLVETSVGKVDETTGQGKVNHHLSTEADGKIPYEKLYGTDGNLGDDGRGDEDKIFDVTTQYHRYQVTYKETHGSSSTEEDDGTLPGGVDVAFTVTNRRLGNINLTVNKHWVDGRTRDGGEEVSDTTLSDEIGAALEKIYSKDKTRLALVFRLVFDESMGKTEEDDSDKIENGTGDNWEITYSGPYAGDDTVSVGGEDAYIYGKYDSGTGEYSEQVSSEQIIIGLDKNGEAVYSDNAYFYGLPKYDSDGNAVAYSVKEVWLDVTNADSGTPPKEVTLSEMQTDYPDLYALWSDYTDPEFEWDYDNNVDGRHTLDIQTLKVTNRRNTPKNVSWTKVWMDNYTNESGLRPDLYLDIYRVVHVAVTTTSGGETGSTSTEGGTDPSTGQEPETTTTYERRIEYVGSSGDWQRNGDNNTWTLTLENVDAFDDHGFAIYYYAVERTTQPADRYDYQAGKYSLDSKDLGTRDEAADGADILSADTNQVSGDYAYDLLVLGTRAGQTEGEEDLVDSIPWADPSDQPDNIGPFGNGSNYAKYALVENGTFTNTLAEEYSINGMKYWTNLSGWDTETRLPGVKFLVYRYTQDTIEPMGTNAFELYAPNGMPWVYSLSEPVTNNNRLQINLAKDDAEENNIYAPPADTGGTWKTTIRPTTGAAEQNTDFGSLTNTTHMEYKFSKEWVDENGDRITENYLGEDFELTVSFQLQVSADNKVTWQDASKYFKDQEIDITEMRVTGTGVEQGTGDAWDTATITATVDATVWGTGGTFTKLPTVLKIGGQYTLLQYRVIETSVTYNGITQEIKDLNLDNAASGATTTGSYTVDTANGSLVSGATFTRYNNAGKSTSTNKLETTSVSVTKVWDDTDNQYGTRPGADEPWTWGSWFVLQRSTTPSDDTSWQNVAVFEKLYGNNAESANDTDPDSSGRWTDTITGLPTMDYSGENAEPYTYRVRELQPKDGGYSMTDEESINDNIVDDVEPGNVYNPNGSTYTTTYQESPENYWTVTNALDLYTPDGKVTEITAKKVWAVPSTDETAKPSVTFQLQYCTESGNWTEAPFDNAEQLASSDNNWTVLWEDLPTTIGGEEVTYQVVELDENGWVQIDQPIQLLSGGEAEYTFINTFARDYTVEKKWNPGTAEAQNVTVWLYRTTNPAQVGSSSEARVPENEMVPGSAFLEATLNNGNSWSVTFQGLPKYDASGRLYYYYALELNGTTPIPQNGSITIDETSYEVSYDWTKETRTTVTNTTATSLTGTKTWVDNDNAYHTRPGSLTLILERKTDTESNWTNVSDIYSPTWTDSDTGDTNIWTYTYAGLPSCDANGAEYTYRVREDVPDGYDLRDEVTSGQGDVKPDVSGNYNFINVLTGTVTISGQKIWNGGVGTEPTLTLERRLSGSTDETAWTEVTVTGQPTWDKSQGNTWTYTYTGLDKYNKNGVLYEYRVREKVPEDYEAAYKTETVGGDPATPVDGLTITNYKDGSLTVSKTVSGNRGDQNEDFTFTVKLTGSSSAGTAAESITKAFPITGDTDGATTLQFTNGESATFTLKHGESITIQGLPAGIGYEVVEQEADQNGYHTSGIGWIGEIPAGGTVSAAFENYRHDSGGGDDDRIDLTGTKTWVDDGENDSARPVSITLYLFRQISGGPEERVYT